MELRSTDFESVGLCIDVENPYEHTGISIGNLLNRDSKVYGRLKNDSINVLIIEERCDIIYGE